MSCNEWIKQKVKGKTFADVGGLWGTLNERVTVAAKAGAAEATMIDIAPLDHEMWEHFHARCRREEVAVSRCLQANVDAPDLAERVGRFDVVHCAGVLYHCPNPLHTVSQLGLIAKEILILGTVVIPRVIANTHGTVSVADNTALLVPALNDEQRRIVAHYFEEVGARMVGINLPLADGWSLQDYTAWWYLFTTGFVAGLLRACGFRVIESAQEWQGRAAYFLAERA